MSRTGFVQPASSYLNETLTLLRYAVTTPFSITTSSSATSATRRSRSDDAARSTADAVARSQLSGLVPTNWMILYTLSATVFPLVGSRVMSCALQERGTRGLSTVRAPPACPTTGSSCAVACPAVGSKGSRPRKPSHSQHLAKVGTKTENERLLHEEHR